MACCVHKDLRRTASDKVLCGKAFAIAYNTRTHLNFFDKKSRDTTTHTETGIIFENKQLPNELHKLITTKFKKPKIYSSYRDNICAVDLADMQLISKQNKGVRFLLLVIATYSRYSMVVSLKDKKGITLTNAPK